MFREVYRWNVIDAIKDKKEVYAIYHNGEEVEVMLAKFVSLENYTEEDKIFFIEWIEGEENE